ncbi:DUF4992 family lipoprotein [Parabacteroides sp. FAFU027]|uniref:DUF4992 family lipoprotein n=1 Tax=Parabacteroides sp. FAFU027 TaxID=2922715 RepID=UPI001FAF767C|nr:DUF4992 family lipoprotein [Parabacteroides sp. FAFU027]
MKMRSKFRTLLSLVCIAVALSITSCIDGFKDNLTWAPSVQNAQLESPAADQITVTPSADGSKLTFKWPVVYGAGGYQFSLYIVDDPTKPVLVGTENEVVDGTSVERPMQEDTRYKVVIKTLGNAKYNNTEATTATEKLYDNLLAITATIPSGTNLTDYFTANPIPASTTELCYQLEPNGNYTMSGDIAIGSQVTIRGDKVNHAKIAMTNGSFVNNGVGFKMKFMDIDYSGFAGANTSSIILMSATPNPAITLTSTGYTVVPTTAPIAIQSCKITGLKYYLFYDNSKKYGIGSFLIKDCIIGQNTNSFGFATIRFGAGMVKDMTITNSTFYNEVVANSSNRICQISSGNAGSVKPLTETWANGSVTITHSTFYHCSEGAQSFNSNGAMGQVGDKITIQKCVIVNSAENAATSGSNGFVRRFRRGNTNATFTGGGNSYWYNGAFPIGEVQGTTSCDTSGDYIDSDPQLTYQGNGVFKMEGATQIAKGSGDPRWLPSN